MDWYFYEAAVTDFHMTQWGERTTHSVSEARVSLGEQEIDGIRLIFGAKQEPLGDTLPEQEPVLKVTNLGLVLIGTISSDNPYNGIATLKNKKNRVQAFHCGSEILPDIYLGEVYPTYVYLEHGERKLRLEIPKTPCT